jgi:aminoacrylate hydrolase
MTPSSALTLADGASLRVHVDGQGPDLMLISGLGGTAGFWAPLLPLLTPHRRVIRFDQRGIASSTRSTAAVDIEQLARDALAVLEHAGSERALLVGHSTGGAIVQRMARLDPRKAAGAVLSGTWLKPNRYMQELFEARLEMLAAAPRAYAATGVLLGYPPDWLNSRWGDFEAAVAAAPVAEAQQAVIAERIRALLAFDGTQDLAYLPGPTLIAGAADDLIVPAFLQSELAARLPTAAVHVFPSGGHFFPVTRAAEFTRLVLELPTA